MNRDTAPNEDFSAERTIFCPKCGAEAFEDQRFCKLCGTKLQLIIDALKGGEAGQNFYGLDIDALKKNAAEFARSWKAGWEGVASEAHRHRQRSPRSIQRDAERAAASELRRQIRQQNLPKPKEWLGYSWQHNLRNGLVSLFGGAGLGIVLYYLSAIAISEGVLERLQEATDGRVHGLEPLVKFLWLFALIPVLKGLAQIIYAAFFAESIATLAERFTVKLPPAPASIREPEVSKAQDQAAAPASVTEHTTQFFDDAKPRVPRESQ
jgi:hypothetical protein